MYASLLIIVYLQDSRELEIAQSKRVFQKPGFSKLNDKGTISSQYPNKSLVFQIHVGAGSHTLDSSKFIICKIHFI